MPISRLERFRNDLIAVIPRFPNDRASLQAMQQKHITDVLITYINWRNRFVGQRPRTTTVSPDAKTDARWSAWEPQLEKLLVKVRAGDDLTPSLSLAPKTEGFTPKSSKQGATSEERWSDRDQVLNVMGYHHFHLGDVNPPLAHADRTNELAFCHVTRTTFEVVAIFDHDVFNMGTAERMRLLTLHNDRMARAAPPGSFILMSGITTAGTTIDGTFAAIGLVKQMNAIDRLLDDATKRHEILDQFPTPVRRPTKLSWHASHLDFGLFDKDSTSLLVIHRGPT